MRGEKLAQQEAQLRDDARDLLVSLRVADAAMTARIALLSVRDHVDDPAMRALVTAIDGALRSKLGNCRPATAAGWNGAGAVLAERAHARKPKQSSRAFDVAFVELWLRYARERRIGETTALRAIGDKSLSFLRQRGRRGGARRRDEAERVPARILAEIAAERAERERAKRERAKR